MHRSTIVTTKTEKTPTMRDASSASPSGSSATLNTDSSMTTPAPPPAPRCLCLNCNKPMRAEEALKQREELIQAEEDGKPRNLIDLISHASMPMDAPVCKKCATELANGMQTKLEMLEDDCIKYRKLIDDLKAKHSNTDISDYKSQIDKLKREEADLIAEFRALVAEEERVDRELLAEKRALEVTTAQEEEQWRALRDQHAAVVRTDDETRALNMEIRYAETQLRKLSSTSVLGLAFEIDVDPGPPSKMATTSSSYHPALASRSAIGTINGFRLGRLSEVPVDWPEINAAWGQAALLLDILMERFKTTLPGVRLHTLASFSYFSVERVGMRQPKDYPLYANGSWRPFGNKNMDGGACLFMEALALVCNTISERMQETGTPILWPHKMRGDKLVDGDMEHTVKMQFNSEERWTRAMRALLLNLKWASAMVAHPE